MAAPSIILLFNIDLYQYEYFEKFLRIFQVYYLFETFHLTFSRFLNLTGKGIYLMGVVTLSIGFNVAMNYVMVIYLDLSLEGSSVAFYLTGIFNVLLEIILIATLKPSPDSMFFFNKESFDLKGLLEYLKSYATYLPLVLCNMLNKDVLNFIAFSMLNSVELAATITSIYVSKIFFSITVGTSITILGSLGFYIGKKQYKKVFPILFYIICLGLIVVLIISIVLAIFQEKLISYFANGLEEVKQHTIRNFPYICIFCFTEVFNYNMVIWLKGLGNKVFAILVSFLQYFIFQPIVFVILVKVFNYDDLAVWIVCIIAEVFSLTSCIIFTLCYLNIEKASNDVYLNIQRQIDQYKHEYHLISEKDINDNKIENKLENQKEYKIENKIE